MTEPGVVAAPISKSSPPFSSSIQISSPSSTSSATSAAKATIAASNSKTPLLSSEGASKQKLQMYSSSKPLPSGSLPLSRKTEPSATHSRFFKIIQISKVFLTVIISFSGSVS